MDSWSTVSNQPNGSAAKPCSSPVWSSTVIPKPVPKSRWRLCKYARIYRILLWKNWLIRRRSPVLLIAELLFPLLFVLILVAFRLETPVYTEPACHVQSLSMPSMGLLHYIQSMVCNFNYTCHSQDPVPLTLLPPDTPLFYLVRNLTDLIADRDVREMIINFQDGLSFEHIPVLLQVQTTLSSLWTAYEAVSLEFAGPSTTDPVHKYMHTAREASRLLCGQQSAQENDLGRLITVIESFEAFNVSDFLQHMEPSTDPAEDNQTDLIYAGRRRAHQVNLCGFVEYLLTLNPIVNAAGRLRQFLFGQVAYYPQTPLTDHIVRLAAERHQLLVKLHQLCKFYFNSTRPWIEELFRDPDRLQAFRNQIEVCAEDDLFLPTSVANACRSVLDWSSPTKTKATQLHWSATMDNLDFLVGLIESMLDCIQLQDKFVPFTDRLEFDAFLERNQIDLLRSPIGLIFERLPFEWDNESLEVRPFGDNQSDFVSIVLRKSPFLIDTTFRYKVLDYYWTPAPRRNPNTDMKYFTSGFIDLQEDISRAIVKLLSPATNTLAQQITNPGTEFKLFPVAPFVHDGFMDFFAPNLPQLMVLAWSLTVVSAVKYMVDEKEHGLTEMLALLGVPSVLVQASWFTVSIILILGSCVPILAILKLTGIVANSNAFLLFCFTMSYAIAILSFAVMCSCFFRRANLAAVASGCVYFIFYLPAPLLLRYENLLSPDILLGASLLPQVSHSFGWAYFIRLEIHGPGAQWDNLWQGDSTDGPYSLGLAFVFLWSSVVLHLTLAVFVIPWTRLAYRWVSPAITRLLYGPRGQVTYTGWVGALRENRLAAFLRERRLTALASPDSSPNTCSLLTTSPDSPPPSQSTVQPTVVIRQLNKTYRYPHFVALDDVSLNMYPDEITVILGHNGAGKTTLMSILTGTSQPTSGTVFINGFDIRTQMDEVREQMGYCPQRDILYADLTVSEHIRFYSALKGLRDDILRTKVDAYLEEFNFQTKRNALAKTLSGGQRRKLSVCLAFVGDASVVLLDEPTAGVDPLSKRVIWDTICGMRPGRTVIFTSHHMREAEFLSDHIAILSRGRVCCASSSVSLKAKYGVGYVITVDKTVDKPNRPTAWSDLTGTIQKFIPQATVISDTVHYLKMRIPLEAALAGDDLIHLFRHFESQSYGPSVSVTDTSLEDIFIEIMTLTVPDWADTSGSSSALMNLDKEFDVCSSNGKSNGMSPLPSPSAQSPAPNGSLSPTLSGLLHHDLDASQSTTTATTHPESENSSCILTTSRSFISQQTAVVCSTRFHHLQRNKMLWVLEFLLPCCMVLLSLILLTLYRPNIDQPAMDLHPWLMTAKRQIPLVSFIANDICDSGSIGTRSPTTGTILQSLVRENPWAWTGVRCFPRAIYRSRPEDLIECSPVDPSKKWITIPANQSGSDVCYGVNFSQSLPPVPHQVLPTRDILLNLTHFNIPNYLLHAKPDVPGEMYGGLTVNTIHERSNASTKAVVELIIALRDWFSLLLWGSNMPNSTNQDVAHLLDMDFSTFIRLLLPSGDQFRIWYNNKGYAAAPAYLNQLHNLQLYVSSGASDSGTPPSIAMVVANHPLPFPKQTWSFTFRETLKIDAAFALFLLLALSFIPANFVVLLVAERELGIKHLHYVSGLRPHLYWFVNYTWDLLTYTVMTFVCMVFLAIFQKVAFIGPTTVLPFMLIVILHGCAIIPLIYLTTFAFRQSSTAFVLVCAINMLIATVTTSISFLLELLTLQEPMLQTLTSRVQFVLRIFPHYCLGSGIYDLSVTRFLVEQGLLPEQTSAATWSLLYPRMLCLVAHTFCFLIILALLESRNRLQLRWPHRARAKTAPAMVTDFDEDVEKTESLTPKTSLDRPLSAIEICRLSKRYRRQPRPAVDNLNLTVHAGECFGLLGTNGAGKSTTFAMLSGKLAVKPGTVIVNGYDLSSQLSQAHQFMGFCPQSDALHEFLTARETLIMYGRLRNLSGAKLQSVVRLLLHATGLGPYANRLVRTYSGGTKRKLSAAIAFIGDPKVILLDEPSSGMDPSARKLLWRLVQSAVHRGCTVVLSSHCMEECETLCNRVGLLVDGRVRCDGGPLELKVRYSVGYVVDLELTHTAIQLDRQELELQLGRLLPGIRLRFPLTTRQQYSYAPTDKLSNLFEALQTLRKQHLIKHFSVKHSTLEDAFVRCINQAETTTRK